MRVMSGSTLNEHVDRRWMEVALLMQGPDGLLYFPTKGRPWARLRDSWGSADADHFGFPFYCGRMLGAMSLYYLRDGSGVWRTAVQRLVDGLAAKAIEREDYAYYSKDVFVPGQPGPGDATMPTGVWASALVPNTASAAAASTRVSPKHRAERPPPYFEAVAYMIILLVWSLTFHLRPVCSLTHFLQTWGGERAGRMDEWGSDGA